MSTNRQTSAFLDSFFQPESVAVIGLSRAALHSPVSVLTTLKDFGYEGRIYIVNPNMAASDDDGFTVCRSLDALPESVDVAIVSVTRELVLEVLKGCQRNGIRSVVIITQGFADADAEGARLQAEMVAFARMHGMRIVGPNTIGVSSAFSRFTSSFIEVHHDEASVGLVSQSGLFMMGHLQVNNEPAGFSMSIDLGNGCDVDLVDVLDYYEHRHEIQVIQCHVEAIELGQAFIETAARVSRVKPIIALKAGRTESGRAAVASHSGAAAGQAEVYRAAFEKAGVVNANNAEELRVLAKAFRIYQPPAGDRVAIMSFSGGGGILAIDAIESSGLRMAVLSPSTRSAMQDLFPSWMSVDNPVDVWIPVAKNFEASFPRILQLILDDPGVDAVICIYCSYTLPKYAAFDSSRYIASLAARFPHKPIMCWSYGMDIAGFSERVEKLQNTMVFRSLDEATGTLARLLEYGKFCARQESPGDASRFAVDADRVAGILDDAKNAGRAHLFTQALQILEAYGIDTATWHLVADRRELVALAGTLRYPVCLKIVSDDIVHKTDSGGVILDIPSADALLDTYRQVMQRLYESQPQVTVSGVLVQAMTRGGHELMIGARRDPAFGPCLVVGAGGIYTEILDDFAFGIAPISVAEANAMLARPRIGKILAGARGNEAADMSTLADILLKVSRLVCEHPAISELDINPLIVGASGACVVDARIIL